MCHYAECRGADFTGIINCSTFSVAPSVSDGNLNKDAVPINMPCQWRGKLCPIFSDVYGYSIVLTNSVCG